MSRRTLHPEWCTGGHRCQLGEHRAAPLPVSLPGVGRAVLTRVESSDGRQHAEITITVALSAAEPAARRQLAGLIKDLHTTITRAYRRAVA